jgi:murein DD-endopeptidase MepM/ murein hydrolase activator NlpD
MRKQETTWRLYCRIAPWVAALLLVLAVPVSPRAGTLALNGPLTQGALIFGQTDPGTRITLEGKDVQVTADGRFIIGFGRDAEAQATLEAIYANGTRETRELEIRRRSYPEQRIEGLLSKLVTPPEEVLDRIRKEQAMVGERKRRNTPVAYFESGFDWPLVGRISGVYGSRRILNGKPRRPHFGVDIAAPTGTPVKAPADGIVALAHPGMYFSGQTLMLDHGYGLTSAFLHLSAIEVEEGQKVKRGETIARVGASGRVTGAHLDWRINWFSLRLDPQTAVPPMPWPEASER